MKDNLILLGCGGVARCFLELLKIDNSELQHRHIIIVEPRNLPDWVHQYYPKAKHIQIAINPDNYVNVLEKYLNAKAVFVDLSVEVDCIEIMKLCQKHKTLYVNTSLEAWESVGEDLNDNNFEARTLYARYNLIKKAVKKDTSSLFDIGCNPGAVSQFCKLALYDCAMHFGDDEVKDLANKNKFNLVAEKLGLEEIHISEHDTQKTYKHKPDGVFWNTWSPLGMQSEMNDPIMIGGNKKPFKDVKYIKPTHGIKNVLFIDKRGCDMLAPTVGVTDVGEEVGFTGYLIPHGEANTISATLKHNKYIPTVYYVYRPSDVAIESINEVKKNGYKINHDWYNLENKDIKSGYDSVGVTLYFKNGVVWWAGTVLSIEQVRQLGFKYGAPTQLQVAITILRGLEWLMSRGHKNEGLLKPEDLPYREIIDKCRKYLGNVYSKKLDV